MCSSDLINMRENSKLITAIGIFLLIIIIILPSIVGNKPGPEMKDAISTNEAENDTNTEILRMYTTDYLNMRTGPGTEFEKIITILPGEMVQVIEREGNWAKVVFDGETGYCSLEYLEIELLE